MYPVTNAQHNATAPLAVITGASSGIGRATAQALARRGYTTVLLARRDDRLAPVARELVAHAPSFAYPLDVSQRQMVQTRFAQIIDRHGPPRVLVNAAGYGQYQAFADMTLDDHDRLMRVNYFGTLWCIHSVRQAMLDHGGGHIINLASIAARMGPWGHAGYAAAKAAVVALTQSLAGEHARTPLRFSVVLPGIVDTAFFDKPSYAALAPQALRHAITPDRVARAILRTIDRPKLEVVVPGHYRALDVIKLCSTKLAHQIVTANSRPIPPSPETPRDPLAAE
ncbi:MAG: SDR family NAD(P)-dependent oxidoreductase [Planctomycetes bacterium]|nr:SDR family NAD(P)-dependent oxidoreductase [Planctomycetota bacterium]